MRTHDDRRTPALRRAGAAAVAALALLTGACATEVAGPAGLEVGAGEDAEREPLDERGPQVGDHWHAALGVHVCGEWLADLAGFDAQSGIHTHGDGLIHIHPFSGEATGAAATLAVFVDGTDELDVTPGRLEVDGRTYRDGDDCDGEPGTVRIAWWPEAERDEHEVVADPADLRFLADAGAVTIAFLPEGDEIPKPPGAVQALVDIGALAPGTVTPPPPDGPGDLEDLTSDIDPVDVSGEAFAIRPVIGELRVPECPTDWVSEELAGCVALGDPAIGAEAIAAAEATEDQLGRYWAVRLDLTGEGAAAVDDLATSCFNRMAACPTGRAAIVADGAVVAAPSFQTPEFEGGEVLISGQFTEAEARQLAATLAG